MNFKEISFDYQLNSIRTFYQAAIAISLCYIFVKIIPKLFHQLYFIYHYIGIKDEDIPSHPLWGHLRLIIRNFPITDYSKEDATANFYYWNKRFAEMKKTVIIFWISWYPVAFVFGHQAVETILNKQQLSKPWFYKFFAMRDGLIVSTGSKWKARRRMLEPFYVTKKQRKFVGIMDNEMNKLTDSLKDKTGKPVDVGSMIPLKVLNIVNKSVVGVNENDFPTYPEKLLRDFEIGSHFSFYSIFLPLFAIEYTPIYKMFTKAVARFESIIFKFIDTAKLRSDNNQVKDNSDLNMIELLVKQNADEETIAEETMCAIIAGHETTTIAIQLALYNCGLYTDIQERLYQEIISVFPDDTPIDDLDKINQCVYLDQFIKESLRLYPPISVFGRKLDEDVILDGKRFLKGTFVAISILGTHLDPEIYPDPHKFDPDRWLPEKAAKIPKSAYIPFSYGPRTCIGYKFAINEIKVCLIHMIRAFKIQSLIKPEEIGCRIEIALKTTKQIKLILTHRVELNNN